MYSKNMFFFLCTIIFIAVGTGCEKKESFIKSELKAKLYYNDTILKKGILVPASGVDVFLSPTQNISDYLFKTKSNSDGSFSFSYQPSDQSIYLLAKTTINTIEYSKVESASNILAYNEMTMLPNIKYGIKVIATDSLGNKLRNANVCLFTSIVVFNKDSCEYASRTERTNESGAVFFNETTPGNYYVKVKADYGNLSLKGKDSVVVVSAVNTLQIECKQ